MHPVFMEGLAAEHIKAMTRWRTGPGWSGRHVAPGTERVQAAQTGGTPAPAGVHSMRAARRSRWRR